jgi:hypothetical protein
MNTVEAFVLFRNINSLASLDEDKYEAIQQVINAETINSITKREVLNVVEWLFNKRNKYRWHDLRDNPNDLPDVKHRRKAYFHVAQAGKETRPAILQYKKDFGFGIYNEFGNGPKFTDIDTDLVAPVVAWKEIEDFVDE